MSVQLLESSAVVQDAIGVNGSVLHSGKLSIYAGLSLDHGVF